MSRFDFALEVEDATVYLEQAIKTLRLLTEGLSHEMHVMEKANAPTDPRRVLEYCPGLFVVERELDRIKEALEASVTEEYAYQKEDHR